MLQFPFYLQSDIDHAHRSSTHAFTKDSKCWNREMGLPRKPHASGHQQPERSVRHKDLSKSHDGYSVSIICLLAKYNVE